MKKSTKKWILTISLAAILTLGLFIIPSTRIPMGNAVLHYKGTDIVLTIEESLRMRTIFSFKFYDPGIGGCSYEEDVSISFGNTVYAIATDDCPTARNWNDQQCFEFNRLEFPQIAALFQKYCGDTPID